MSFWTHARGPFAVWAPDRQRVRLVVDDPGGGVIEMTQGDDGWWSPEPAEADHVERILTAHTVDYSYVLDDDRHDLPDPRSRRQHDVDGRSRLYDPSSFAWTDGDWRGRQLAGSVVYELHVGTFTPAGTLDAAMGRLDHLRSIGVDLVELMPVNVFDGTHDWGYDGVAWFAVTEAYGGPPAYQRFVDACHASGLGVVQDVVYNHLGPSGNHLPSFGPYLKQGANTWGDLVNLDGEGSAEVRRFILDNARMWFADYHVDALRLDAVHALSDASDVPLLEELAVQTAALSAHLGRPLTLIAESDLNDTRLVTPREGGGYGLDAQWSDDFHHAVHVALTAETSGYYADFAPLSALAKVCERGFFHDGTWSSFRDRHHGRPVDTRHMPTWRLVVCTQNHDQVGNRARGDRLSDPTPGHLDDDQLVCAALLNLLGPFTPMLFMGEEWAASTPFQFFTSFGDRALARATAEGRVAEFARMGWDPDQVPDPQDPATFECSKLDWSERERGRHAVVLDCYRRLGALRRRLPALTDPAFADLSAYADEERRVFTLQRGGLVIAVNFSGVEVRLGGVTGELLFTTPSGASVGPDGLILPSHAGVLLASTPALAADTPTGPLVSGTRAPDPRRSAPEPGGPVPVLHTSGLLLRPPAPEDAPEAFELLNDPDVLRFNPARACPDLATAEAWCRDGADWSDGSHATWHAVDPDTRRMVGNVSLFAIDAGDRVAKIGYRVLASARGRGVARRMVDAVTRWAFTERGLMRVQLEHAIGNPASCRVAEAAGFVLEGVSRSAYALPEGGREDCHIHGRLATDPAPAV